ncbi:hypothetical protein ACUOFU_04195 [Microbacterium arabinogalactanolyticum]|uniref:hypothetical protein n=1 Tax=Microbacterium arabinogalactanolyticum TaxID=69365 RepID=UPI00404417CB
MEPTDPVRAAYVVLSHREQHQVLRLASAILRSSPTARVLIAHDARTEPFSEPVDDERIDVFAHGLATDWGSWQIVEATLLALDRARARWDPQLVVVISGQDYPVRPLAQWEAEALESPSWTGEADAAHFRMFWGRRHGEGDERYTRYAFRWFRAPLAGRGRPLPAPRFRARVRRAIAVRLAPVFGIRVLPRGRGRYYGFRRVPLPFNDARPMHVGSQWIAVRREELDLLLDESLAPGSRLRRIYRRSIIPDESALVTPLSWHAPPGPLAPVSQYRLLAGDDGVGFWTIDDLDELRASRSPFCRKVDLAHSAALMDALDAGLGGSPSPRVGS